jgi:hypothetical protein
MKFAGRLPVGFLLRQPDRVRGIVAWAAEMKAGILAFSMSSSQALCLI